MVPAVALKVAVVAPACTPTLAGTVNNALLLFSVTVTPPPLAAFDSVMVHVEAAPEFSVAGVQESRLGTTDEPSRIESDCELPFNDAVILAD
jgi:hypothetical protein